MIQIDLKFECDTCGDEQIKKETINDFPDQEYFIPSDGWSVSTGEYGYISRVTCQTCILESVRKVEEA